MDKFELICADMFDPDFQISEKVDAVVCSYVLSTFITTYEDLKKILTQCRKLVKDDGYVLITDFSWEYCPSADNEMNGSYSTHPNGEAGPEPFGTFQFFIPQAPNDAYEIYNIPSSIMHRAGIDAGFTTCDFKLQYPNPEKREHPTVKKWLKDNQYTDYIMKFGNRESKIGKI